jgi:hypothetical protein
MSAMKRSLRTRLVSVTDQRGEILYDRARQPKLHAASQREHVRAQAERTNQVYREASSAPKANPRTRFARALSAAFVAFRREMAQ